MTLTKKLYTLPLYKTSILRGEIISTSQTSDETLEDGDGKGGTGVAEAPSRAQYIDPFSATNGLPH